MSNYLLRGSLQLTSGESIPLLVMLTLPKRKLGKREKAEIVNARVALHDLTPIGDGEANAVASKPAKSGRRSSSGSPSTRDKRRSKHPPLT